VSTTYCSPKEVVVDSPLASGMSGSH
jgi:hypothetical protein